MMPSTIPVLTARQVTTLVRSLDEDTADHLRGLTFMDDGEAFDSAASSLVYAASAAGLFGEGVDVMLVTDNDPNEWGAVLTVALPGGLRVATSYLSAKDLLDDRDGKGMRLWVDLLRNVAVYADGAVGPLRALLAAQSTALHSLVDGWEQGAGEAYECAGLPADPTEHPDELPGFDSEEAENYGAALIYQECADALRTALAAHPDHVDCADACGLAVTHDGACLDQPGGRVVCDSDNHEDDDQ